MDRQLKSPILIDPIGPPTKLSTETTYQHLLHFLQNSSFGASSSSNSVTKIQLERLNDALGVSIGKINIQEEERRENERKEARAAKKAERRRIRAEQEAQEQAQAQENLEGLVEALQEDEEEEQAQEEEGELESGAVKFEDEQGGQMDDRGDVEYGDNLQDEDEDEPDNQDEDGDGDAKMDSD
ncbi:uncharacterized protein I303_102723 [Kwoniella dejecticola CBS 10117]|uniref:Uncharacterized protein n=1 Tax=Kwoniella dejecticola CBS 10117 TaxID=1296121 RepID=A0A1A6A9J3_9TREE|nr:uncharacterized protein I303_02738 [Kwoniella dejecticola CBS 10117]OBR86725.1 hypothetical protein I303_02738 [Kwoniella dejecticola CBS 10117]